MEGDCISMGSACMITTNASHSIFDKARCAYICIAQQASLLNDECYYSQFHGEW